MRTIALAGQKGGSTRSTLATSLAVLAEAAGVRTVIFDLDPQASAAAWGDAREADFPDVVAAQAPRLPRLIEQAEAGGCGLAVLDCPPNAEGTTLAACQAADFVLIPMRPSPRDMAAAQSTVRLVRDVTKTPFAVVLSACPTNTRAITDEIAAALVEAQVPLCPVRIHHRIAHYSHVQQGLTATEADPKGKAAQELADLYAWLVNQAPLQTSMKTTKQAKRQSSNVASL